MTDSGGLFADYRWVGTHGIGRFAAEVLPRIGAKRLKTTLPLRHPLDPITQSWDVKASRCTKYFSPGYYVPLAMKIPYTFVIHDLIHLRFKSERSLVKALFYNTVIRPGALRAQKVFTVSECSKREILEWTGLPGENVVVVGNGVTKEFRPEGPKLLLPAPYLLYVGCNKPHKNLDLMFRAFAASPEAKNFDLILSGPESASIRKRSRELGFARRLRFLGTISDEKLSEAYRGATSLLFPSLYEGFGLPALEAMACGTAVIVSSGGALEELTNGASVLCDPSAVDSIADAIDRIVSNTSLRMKLIERGKLRASEFAWEDVASRISRSL